MLPTEKTPQQILLQDLNKDNKLDVLVSTFAKGDVSELLGNGDGTFQAARIFHAGTGADAMRLADFNTDGKDDLLWRDNPHTRFAYWIMNGAQLADSAAITVSPQWQFGTAGDFDGSGVAGLIWYNKSSIVMWPGSSTGNYQGVVVHSYPGAWAMLP